MSPWPDILLFGLLPLLDSGLLAWPLIRFPSFNPPNCVEIEASLVLGILGGAKIEASPATVFLGDRSLRMVKDSTPLPMAPE